MKNVLLLYGGGSTEHDISILSSVYIESIIDREQFNIIPVLIEKDSSWIHKTKGFCNLEENKILSFNDSHEPIEIHCALPCLHGYPGETGDIQAFLDKFAIPYFGPGKEASENAFNKVTTKAILEKAGIKTTPYIYLTKETPLKDAESFFDKHKDVYIKAASQGSSVGCYHCKEKEMLLKNIEDAFEFSDLVLIEKSIQGRELEVAVYEHEGVVYASAPGEIITPDDFYDYDEKYSENSKTVVHVKADLPSETVEEIKKIALKSFSAMKLEDISRIDFFLENSGEVFVNEINTFPGHTKISLFPKMVEGNGLSYSDFLNQKLLHLSK